VSYGPIQQTTVTIASGTSTSSGTDFGGKSGSYMTVYHTAGFALNVFGSSDGTNYYPVHERVNTAPVQYQALSIASSTSGAWAQIVCPAVRYVAFAATATVANGTSIKVCVAD
jgi:hypothetical protein